METDDSVKAVYSQVAILVVIIALMAGVLVMSSRFAYTQAKLGPLAVSIIVLVLAIVQLIKELRKYANEKLNLKEETLSSDARGDYIGFASEAGWIGGFIIAIYLLGFYVAVPLFSLVYMKSHQARWIPAISVALLTLAFIYLIFIRILDFRLYGGLVFMMLDR